ncbi:hypothetical protein [Nitriliruptor alkaliphilus]|uniref:hypothetical protein n=1 Tax=Nitriliruptor alkaliphilus TaxID=427918 RepID=UPI0012ED203C|nr:hypothetical protein [Nitriliruptor alkaliphilus]
MSEMAVQLAGDRYERVVVSHVASAITRHPDPVGLEVLDRQVIVEVEIPPAGGS